jgi:uncharacterized membrane protein YphA (DoxX/SURF4 family)
MLTPFPSLLIFSFTAPTLLRIAAALVFAYLAYRHYQNRAHIAHISFPIVGRGEWVAWFAIIIEAGVALGLFFGYYTQYAALLGAIGALKQIIWRGKYPGFFWLTRSAAFLLLVICLSLLLTGAGAFAYDLPL